MLETTKVKELEQVVIRFSGDSGGWLDIVTRERMGEGVVTMPVSVKAMHNWASHAVKFDPEVFFARLIK